MDDLPPPLLLEILSRLTDPADLARCRIASKTLSSTSRDLQSVCLLCSFDRYAKYRSPLTRSSVTPFKQIFRRLLSELRTVKSVSIGVEKPLRTASYDDVEDEEDLYLTDVNFVEEWLPRVSQSLISVSISDFWVQSCWRRSTVLAAISSHCYNLVDLEIKNAWLSVNGLKPMPKLTSLTLEYVRLDDENLDNISGCFPCLQVLNLIGVGGLKDPRVHLLDLRSCYWTVSNAPNSVAVVAPKLVKLKLTCVRPKVLVIDAPLLAEMHFCILKKSDYLKVEEFVKLETLHLESMELGDLLCTFPLAKTIKSLTLGKINWVEPVGTGICLGSLSRNFPNVTTLTLAAGVWSELERHLCPECLEVRTNMWGLKDITAYLVLNNIDSTLSFIKTVLESCPNLSDIALLIHRDVVSSVSCNLISKCAAYCPGIRWRWGMWKEGTKDAWISHSL
nr:F-box/LRR-repeat protein At4g29420 [Ipomoea batatas]